MGCCCSHQGETEEPTITRTSGASLPKVNAFTSLNFGFDADGDPLATPDPQNAAHRSFGHAPTGDETTTNRSSPVPEAKEEREERWNSSLSPDIIDTPAAVDSFLSRRSIATAVETDGFAKAAAIARERRLQKRVSEESIADPMEDT